MHRPAPTILSRRRTYTLTTATRSPSEDPGVFPRDGEIAHLECHCHLVPTLSTVTAHTDVCI